MWRPASLLANESRLPAQRKKRTPSEEIFSLPSALQAARSVISGGWKPALTGRQDARRHRDYAAMIFLRMAKRTSSVCERKDSFFITLARCVSTVRGLM